MPNAIPPPRMARTLPERIEVEADSAKRPRALRARDIKPVIKHMQPGHGMRFAFPGQQPYNRISYQAVNAAAYALWGAGSYQLQASKDDVLLIRNPDPLDDYAEPSSPISVTPPEQDPNMTPQPGSHLTWTVVATGCDRGQVCRDPTCRLSLAQCSR